MAGERMCQGCKREFVRVWWEVELQPVVLIFVEALERWLCASCWDRRHSR